MPTGAVTTASPGPDRPVPGARTALALLLAINMFNYIDRQVLSAVLPRLKLDGTIIAPDDPDPNFKLGLLTSAFMVTYMLFSPVFGWLDGRRVRRWLILGLGVTVWSLASGSSGLATGYVMLLATRCLVGIGEAAYAPVASAMLSDAFPARQRGPVLAAFNMAIPVGSALGFGIGGLFVILTGDWRPAFWFTFIGLLLGAVCFTRKELPRPAPIPGVAQASYWDVLKMLRLNRSFVLCCAGMTAITFVLGGLAAWVPVYFFEREARFHLTPEIIQKLSADETPAGDRVPADEAAKLLPLADGTERTFPQMKAALNDALGEGAKRHAEKVYKAGRTPDSPNPGTLPVIFGGILVVAGLGGTALGAWLGESLRKRGVRGAYFLVIGGGAGLAIPAFLGVLYTPLPVAWGFAFVAMVGLFMHVGPGNTILANVTTSDIRGTAFAINVLVIHALGDVISPPLIGAVADRSSLQLAFLLTTTVIGVGAVLWVSGARFLDTDTVTEGPVNSPPPPATQ